MKTPIESLATYARANGPKTPVIVGPWPSYGQFKNLPERERWVLYGSAKAYRDALELQGLAMSESYDEFIKRVCTELDL